MIDMAFARQFSLSLSLSLCLPPLRLSANDYPRLGHICAISQGIKPKAKAKNENEAEIGMRLRHFTKVKRSKIKQKQQQTVSGS